MRLRPPSALLSHAAGGCLLSSALVEPSTESVARRPNTVPLARGAAGSRLQDDRRASLATFARTNASAPTAGVRRENDRAREYAAELERVLTENNQATRSLSCGSLGLPKPESPKSAEGSEVRDLDEQNELFQKTAADASRMLEGIARSVRLEHLSEGNQESKLKAEREEERRQQALEERRARQRERQARDPRRKVALKVENRRRFGRTDSSGGLCGSSVPMCEVTVCGEGGHETVGMVDVAGLRSRCQRLNNTGSKSASTVDLLLQDQRQRELQKPNRKTPGLQSCASAPMMCELRSIRRNLKR